MQDVPAFLLERGIALADYLDARKPAVIDAEHCVRLNWEAFFFGDLWERERFLADPVTFCGLLTDPISRRRFRPTADSPQSEHEHVTYYFETEANRTLFESDPPAFRLPGWKM